MTAGRDDDRRRSILGAGPRIAAVTLCWAAVAAAVQWAAHPALWIVGTPGLVLRLCGGAMLAAGAVLYGAWVRRAWPRLREGGLVTTGPFARCRHPLYATWILLILPGMCLLVGSWPVLTVPLVAYAAARVAVRQEERELASRFGAAYADYARSTPCLVPRFR